MVCVIVSCAETFWTYGKLARTDMYMAHFLGAHDAVYFINGMRFDPNKSAVATFPEAAEYNVNVFYEVQGRKIGRERSLKEVYGFFEKKFDKNLYEGAPAAVAPAPKLTEVHNKVSSKKVTAKKLIAKKPVVKKKQQKRQK